MELKRTETTEIAVPRLPINPADLTFGLLGSIIMISLGENIITI